jgi:transposase-like protein
MTRVGKTSVRQALETHGGVISKVAESFNVSRQTVYNWIERYELREVVERTRDMMFDLAQDNILKAVTDGDVDVSKFVLTHMPTARRWSSRAELTGANGTPLGLSPDVIELMRRMGVEPSEVVKEFEEMVRQQAGVKHDE